MRRSVARLRGLGFIVWHARHEFYHVLLGLVWAWFLREIWQQFSIRWIIISVAGSLAPDCDHFLYFFIYGRKDVYSRQIKSFLKNRQWRILTKYIETGHKYQTDLATHNFYFMSVLLFLSLLSFLYDWKTGIILFGAMLTHYLFDICDDIATLGYINVNWKRWRKPGTSN